MLALQRWPLLVAMITFWWSWQGGRAWSQESLSDLPSFREGCRALEDSRYGTAATQFLDAWETLDPLDSSEVEQEFVAARLIEAWVKNGESAKAIQWIDAHSSLNSHPQRLFWTAAAFRRELHYHRAAEAYAILRSLPDADSQSLLIEHAFCLAMSGEDAAAAELLAQIDQPHSPYEFRQAALAAGRAGLHDQALNWLEQVEETLPPLSQLSLTTWHLASLERSSEATTHILDSLKEEKDPATCLRIFLMLHELNLQHPLSIPLDRITQWANQKDAPQAEGASLFLALNQPTEAKKRSHLSEWLQRYPDSLYATQAQLELGVEDHEPQLPTQLDFAQLYLFSLAKEDFLKKRYVTALSQFSSLASESSRENRFRNQFNAAIAALKAEDFDRFNLFKNELDAAIPDSPLTGQLAYLAGLYQAAHAEPEASSFLENFIRDYPNHPSRIDAQLALAEIHLNQAPARPQAARQSFVNLENEILTLEQNERLDYTRVWLELIDHKDNAFRTRAETFLREWPGSHYYPQIALLLAKQHLIENRPGEAHDLFAKISRDFPDSKFAEYADLFAAKSTPPSDQAILAWKKIAYDEGSDRSHALLALHELGLLYLRLDRFMEARSAFAEIIDHTAGHPELRLAARADTAHAYYLESLAKDRDTDLMKTAADAYATLSGDPATPLAWKYSSAFRRARCLESIGEEAQALEIYRSLVTRSTDSPFSGHLSALPEDSHQSQEWIFRAGFFAIQILQNNQDWRAAIEIADDLSRLNDPRSFEAADLAERLRLKHWVWD